MLHVIPSPLGRGAQRAARSLVDCLNGLGGARHILMALFEGPNDVTVDINLGFTGRGKVAAGFAPALAWRLRRSLQPMDPAVVVAHGGDALKYLVPALAGTGRHLAYCNIGTYAGSATPIRIWPWKWLTRRPQLVVAVGNEVKDECIDRFGVDPDRVVMIPNGRDPDEFYPRDPAGSTDRVPTLIYIGALTQQKRPGVFVDLVGRLHQEGQPVRAQLIGSGPLADTLAARADALGIERLGFRSDVAALLRGADILIFPSLPGGEGMPGVLIEAGLSGIAVVSTAVPGASTVIEPEHTGLIVDGSVDAMTGAVRRLLDDPELRNAMGAEGRRRCMSLYSLDGMARAVGIRAGSPAPKSTMNALSSGCCSAPESQ